MSRRAPRTSNRNIDSGMTNMKIDTSKGSSKMGGVFDRQAATKASSSSKPGSSKAQPTEDDDGFTTVQHRKSSIIDPKCLQVSSGNRQRTISFANDTKPPKRSPPSGAALSRTNVYAAPKPYLKSDIPAHGNFGGKVLHKEQFRPGMLIRALVHEQDFEASSSKSNITVHEKLHDKHRTNSDYGTIYTKCRRMIVLALYQDHYIAIPIFTHDGKGLVHKAQPEEYVSIKNQGDKSDPPALSKRGHIETEPLAGGVQAFHVKSTAHVTYALPRRYDLPVKPEGKLTDRSLNRLLELYNMYVPQQKQAK
ncbi:MAG: hypothetical protein Q9226_003007 [Calogaya cf. arnoldii]